MSRAFVKEDSGGNDRAKRYAAALPARDEPGFDAAAARALVDAARAGETGAGEEATGYYWGEPRLHAHVRAILDQARAARDDRLEQLAERFLK